MSRPQIHAKSHLLLFSVADLCRDLIGLGVAKVIRPPHDVPRIEQRFYCATRFTLPSLIWAPKLNAFDRFSRNSAYIRK